MDLSNQLAGLQKSVAPDRRKGIEIKTGEGRNRNQIAAGRRIANLDKIKDALATIGPCDAEAVARALAWPLPRCRVYLADLASQGDIERVHSAEAGGPVRFRVQPLRDDRGDSVLAELAREEQALRAQLKANQVARNKRIKHLWQNKRNAEARAKREYANG